MSRIRGMTTKDVIAARASLSSRSGGFSFHAHSPCCAPRPTVRRSRVSFGLIKGRLCDGFSQGQSSLEEFVGFDSCLFEDRSQCTFRHIARVIRDRRIPVCLFVEPDFVAACGLPVELKSGCSQFANNFPVPKSGKAAHFRRLPQSYSRAERRETATAERPRARDGLQSVFAQHLGLFPESLRPFGLGQPDRAIRTKWPKTGLPATFRSERSPQVPYSLIVPSEGRGAASRSRVRRFVVTLFPIGEAFRSPTTSRERIGGLVAFVQLLFFVTVGVDAVFRPRRHMNASLRRGRETLWNGLQVQLVAGHSGRGAGWALYQIAPSVWHVWTI